MVFKYSIRIIKIKFMANKLRINLKILMVLENEDALLWNE